MKINKIVTKVSLILSLLIVFYSVSDAADWPNWRGPNYNGISTEKDWDSLKVKDGMKPLWQKSIGIGFSTISVSDGRAYTMGNTGTKGEDESKHNDVIFCFDAETGKEIWKYSYPQRLDPKYYEGGSLATPTIDGGKVYTISKDGKVFCLDTKNSSEIWQKDLAKELGVKRTTWGYSGSPVIIDNLVIYNAGSMGIALNKDDGSLIWKGDKQPGGYATAVPFTSGNQKCIAMFSFSEIIGLDAATGKELWRFPWKTKHNVNASDPIIAGNKIFISSGYGNGCALIKIENGTVSEIWRNKNMKNKMNGSVLWKGCIYGVDEGGELKCLDLKTGKLIWAQKGFGQGSITIADGKLIALGEKGNLVIADATADGYKVISEAKILSPKCWSVPVLANGRIYARNANGDMVCLDVSKDAGVVSARNNWPQWQGPDRDAISRETGLLKKWPDGGPKLIWSAKDLGAGFSSVSIADGNIYVTGLKGEQGVLTAMDLNGNRKWQKPYGLEWTSSHAGSRTTPTIDGDRAYTFSGMGIMSCLDITNGEMKWSVDTLEKFEGKNLRWGMAESVLIDGDKVICTPGGKNASVVALNKMTGETIWTTKDLSEKSAFCSPILVERGSKRLIVTMLAASVVGIDIDSGKVVWSDPYAEYQEKPRGNNPVTPVYLDGYIYTTSGYSNGGAMLELSADGGSVTRKWVDAVLDVHHGGAVVVDGYIYGSRHKGNWVCLDWNSGEVKYEDKAKGKGSITAAEGMLYCYDEKGTVTLAKASPKGFDIVSSFEVTLGEDEHWAHPVILNGRLYIRHGGALMAYDIKAK